MCLFVFGCWKNLGLSDRGMRKALGSVVAAAVLLGTATATDFLAAQEDARNVARFDVAAIKPGEGRDHGFDPERMTWSNMSLGELIEHAYRVRPYQIVGLPKAGSEDRWTIIAKAEVRNGQQSQVSQMLQTLLMERFGLRCHQESRLLPRYVLAVAKNGPKIRPVEQSDPEYGKPGTTVVGRGVLEFRRATMGGVASRLTRELGTEVVDRTGLPGVYSFQLKWAPDVRQANSGGQEHSDDEIGPSIFAALREQLGLEMKGEKGPVDVVVIDRIGRFPTPN